MKKIKVIQDPADEVPAEILAKAIVEVAKGMKLIEASRLTRNAIVALIHDRSRVGKETIHVILNNLDELESHWLKKVPR